jgi:UDP-N-acetylmuramyl pentapeptide synthase
MHSDPGLQACRGSSKVAVLDTIHGASTIAERMAKMGIMADAFEVYHNSPSLADFDLVVAPVHLSPNNPALEEARRLRKKIITHHRAVGELLSPGLGRDLRIFEITGTHSKTTTALLLGQILSSRWKVISHSTRGIELWSNGSCRTLATGLSITPGNVIPASEWAEALEADALVCEISLGGTGLADCGVLTSLSGDYRVAGGTRWASTAKLQMASLAKPGFRLAANTDAGISSDISFGQEGFVEARDDRIIIGHEETPLTVGRDLDFASYETAISAAAAAAYSYGFDASQIAKSLEGFDGFSGRMKVTRADGVTVYDSSNSGLKTSDVAHALDSAGGGRLCLVVGEESQTVCEGLDVPAVVELISRRRDEIDLLVLVGDRLSPWAERLGASIARDLKAGEAIGKASACRSSMELNKLLLCVKCFR